MTTEEITSLKDQLAREKDRSRSYQQILERLNRQIAVLCDIAGAPHSSPHDIHTLAVLHHSFIEDEFTF